MTEPAWLSEWLRLCDEAAECFPGKWTPIDGDQVMCEGSHVFAEFPGRNLHGAVGSTYLASLNPARVRWLLERVRELSDWAQEISCRGEAGHEDAWASVKRYDEGPP